MKKQYIAPNLTVVTFRTERGFAASADNTIDAVANQLNNWASQAEMEVIGDVTDASLWGQEGNQAVSGIGTSDDGLAAGYFSNGSTEDWF